MFRSLSVLAAAAIVLASPSIARAIETKTEMLATVICRPATTSEHGNAMMMAGHAMMVCKAIPSAMIAAIAKDANFGPDLRKALNPQQVDAAWRAWTEKEFAVLPAGG